MAHYKPQDLSFSPLTKAEMGIFYDWVLKDKQFRIDMGAFGDEPPTPTFEDFYKSESRASVLTGAHLPDPDKTFIGHAYAMPLSHGLERNRGYRFTLEILPPWKGMGYGTALGRHVVDLAWRMIPEMESLSAGHRSWSPAQERVYLKCGFRPCGRIRRAFYMEGQWHDKCDMDMIRKEWENSSAVQSVHTKRESEEAVVL